MRLFTKEEADQLIPAVRKIVKAIQRWHQKLSLLQTQSQEACGEHKQVGIVRYPIERLLPWAC
jgi:uncharacterized protein YhaN